MKADTEGTTPKARKPVITSKQKRVARLLASGYTQKAAYEAVYKVNPMGSAKAHQNNGYIIANNPKVKQLIRKYEEQTLPLGDLRAEQEWALGHLKGLAMESKDERVRVMATVKFFELVDMHRATEERIQSRRAIEGQAVRAEPIDAVVSELLALAEETRPAIELEAVEADDSMAEAPTRVEVE